MVSSSWPWPDRTRQCRRNPRPPKRKDVKWFTSLYHSAHAGFPPDRPGINSFNSTRHKFRRRRRRRRRRHPCFLTTSFLLIFRHLLSKLFWFQEFLIVSFMIFPLYHLVSLFVHMNMIHQNWSKLSSITTFSLTLCLVGLGLRATNRAVTGWNSKVILFCSYSVCRKLFDFGF